ncbi:MAG TPA: hypothetical protein VGD77_12135 [Gemmatimonadaceae bacterium]
MTHHLPPVHRSARALLASMLFLVPAALGGQPTLPEPTGPHRVGTTTRLLADSARRDIADTTRARELAVQLWYPTSARSGTRAPYLSHAMVAAMQGAGYLHLDSATIGAWGRVATPAWLDAPVAGGRWPLLVLSHGQGVSRSHYAALAGELASRGYLVASIDHPYGGVMQRADGHVVTLADDPASGPPDSVLAVRVAEWAQDASFVVDQLLDPATSLGRVAAAHVARDRIGMLGHSLGGAAALEACRADTRFHACADLDGMLVGRVVADGPRGATLIVRSSPVYSDADLAKRGRTRAQWEAMGREVEEHFRGVAAKGERGQVWTVVIRGTGHMSFSDAPYTFPDAITRFGGTPLGAGRTFALVGDVVRSFFDAQLKGHSGESLAALAARHGELRLEGP